MPKDLGANHFSAQLPTKSVVSPQQFKMDVPIPDLNSEQDHSNLNHYLSQM